MCLLSNWPIYAHQLYRMTNVRPCACHNIHDITHNLYMEDCFHFFSLCPILRTHCLAEVLILWNMCIWRFTLINPKPLEYIFPNISLDPSIIILNFCLYKSVFPRHTWEYPYLSFQTLMPIIILFCLSYPDNLWWAICCLYIMTVWSICHCLFICKYSDLRRG